MPCTASAVETARTSSTAVKNYTVIGVKIGAVQTLVVRMAAIFLGCPKGIGAESHPTEHQKLPVAPGWWANYSDAARTGAKSYTTEHLICPLFPDGR